MDIQDPLRIRLMSHLQMFIAGRSSQAPPTPVPATPSPANHYQSAWTTPSYNSYSSPDMFDPYYGSPAAASLPVRPPHTGTGSTASTASAPAANYTMTMTATAGSVAHPTPIGFTASVQANPLMFPPTYQVPSHHIPSSEAVTSTASTTPNYANLTSSKPYRPWGAEMAC